MRPHRPRIAELPDPLREEINRKLLAAETYEDIAQWLNSDPEAKTIAASRWATTYSPLNVQRYHATKYNDWLKSREGDQRFDAVKNAIVDAGAEPQAALDNLQFKTLIKVADALPKKDFDSLAPNVLLTAISRLGNLCHSAARLDLARQKILVQHEEKTSVTYTQILDWAKKHPQQALRFADVVDPPGTPLPERDVEDAVFASLGLNPDDMYNRDQ